MEDGALDRALARSRTSVRARVARVRSKRFHIAQCAVAAGVAWLIAADLLGHETPFFAPVAAVVCLGTSYGQRLRRVAEVTLGVAVGVLPRRPAGRSGSARAGGSWRWWSRSR